jgi:hypothetical protein
MGVVARFSLASKSKRESAPPREGRRRCAPATSSRPRRGDTERVVASSASLDPGPSVSAARCLFCTSACAALLRAGHWDPLERGGGGIFFVGTRTALLE